MTSPIFTRTEPILLPYYPRLVYLALLELGYDEAQLFDGLDLSAEQLQDERSRLSIEQHEGFILRALDITDNPNLAVQLGKMLGPSEGNLALMAIANSGRISKALDMMTRYHMLFTRVFSIRLVDVDERPAMELESQLEHERVNYFAISAFLLFLDNFFYRVLGGEHLLDAVDLTLSQPARFEEVRREFAFPIAFDQPKARIYFRTALLDEPLNQTDPQTVRLLIEMNERQLQEAEAEMSFVGSVKSLLVDQIVAPPKLDDAASLLGVSSRGLRRKLAEAGTSYQKLLDSLRLKIAVKLLTDTDTPVSSIGYELGFDNASDFGRAFKRWSGQSPSALRKQRQ